MSAHPTLVVFGFNRPSHLQRVLESAERAGLPRIYVFIDGPRLNNSKDKELTNRCSQLAESRQWAKDLIIVKRESNLGLRSSVLRGLDQVFEKEEFAIVLEDDCVPSPSFYEFVKIYSNNQFLDQGAGMVTGNYFGPALPIGAKPFLASSARIWGWATWSTVWRDFVDWRESEPDVLETIRGIKTKFASPFEYKRQVSLARSRNVDTWDVEWLVFLKSRFLWCITPPLNLVENIGMSSTGTNATGFDPGVGISSENQEWASNVGILMRDERYELREDGAKLQRRVGFAFRHPRRFVTLAAHFLRNRNQE